VEKSWPERIDEDAMSSWRRVTRDRQTIMKALIQRSAGGDSMANAASAQAVVEVLFRSLLVEVRNDGEDLCLQLKQSSLFSR
jgi:hypothetical protein